MTIELAGTLFTHLHFLDFSNSNTISIQFSSPPEENQIHELAHACLTTSHGQVHRSTSVEPDLSAAAEGNLRTASASHATWVTTLYWSVSWMYLGNLTGSS